MKTLLTLTLFLSLGWMSACGKKKVEIDMSDVLTTPADAIFVNCSTHFRIDTPYTCLPQMAVVHQDLTWEFSDTTTCSWLSLNELTGDIEGTPIVGVDVGCFIAIDILVKDKIVKDYTFTLSGVESKPLEIYPEAPLIFVEGHYTFLTAGGFPDFYFAMNSGTGIINNITGTFYSYNTPDTVSISATDAKSTLVTKSIEVFDPKDIASLDLWLKADRFTTLADGDPVSSWSDSSGNGFTATQGTGGSQPLYKENIVGDFPGIYFDGNDDRLTTLYTPPTGANARTFIVVYTPAEIDHNSHTLLSYGGLVGWHNAYGVNSQMGQSATDNQLTPGINLHCDSYESYKCLTSSYTPKAEPTLLVTLYDGTKNIMYINGVKVAEEIIAIATAAGNLSIGSFLPTTHYFKGHIHEIMALDEAISDLNRTRLECAFAYKYRLSVDNTLCNFGNPIPVGGLSIPVKAGTSLTLDYLGGVGAGVWEKLSGSGIFNDTAGTLTFASAGQTTSMRLTDAVENLLTLSFTSWDFPRPEFWFKADSLTGLSDSDPLITWEDSSGHGLIAGQTTVAKRPTYKENAINTLPAIHFDGVNDFLSINKQMSYPSHAVTLVAVIKNGVITGSPEQLILGFGSLSVFNAYLGIAFKSNSALSLGGTTNMGASFYCGGVVQCLDSSVVPNASASILIITYDETTVKIYINGALVGQMAVALGGNSEQYAVTIGARADGGLGLEGDIGEVLGFQSSLTNAERQALEQYLGAKYGIALP